MTDDEFEALEKQYGVEEAKLIKLREDFSSNSNKDNVERLEEIESNLDEISDDESILSQVISEEVDEENLEQSDSDVQDEVIEDEKEVVEDEVETPAPEVNAKDEWLKEKAQLAEEMKQRDELIMKMYTELQAKQQPVEPKEVPVEKPKKDNKEEIKKLTKSFSEKISLADDDGAAEVLASLAEMLKADEVKPVKELDEATLDEMLSKRELKQYEKKLQEEQAKFVQSEIGKKILADEDMLDMYQAKLNRLMNSGKRLNPEDLYQKAYEETAKVFAKNTGSSTASKPVPKVAESLKEGVSKIEETKKQAVKPNASSSSADKNAQTKKYNHLDAWKEMIKATTGQTL